MSGEMAKILLVDDTPANLVAMTRILDLVDARVFPATSAMEALNLCLEHDFALALVDVYMPDMDGYELARTLFSVEETRKLPILFVTSAARDEFVRLRGYELGAVDYIEKPVDDRILLSKVNVFLELFRRRSEQERLVCLLSERQEDLNRMVAQQTQELGKAVRELDTLNACNEALLWFKEETPLLQEICRILVTIGGFLRVWVGLDPDPERHVLTLVAQTPDHFQTEDPLPVSLALSPQHLVWQVLEQGQAFFGLPEENPAAQVCTQSVFPLSSAQGCLGVLVLYSPEGPALVEAQKKPLVSLANNLTHGLEALRETARRFKVQEALKKSEERLHELAIHIEDVREKERRWMAQEVHDEMGNSLANLKMRLLWLKDKLGSSCPIFQRHFPD
ncbi:MAG TPA: response regulator, partial [Magnetococcales bacterium]|nr:response regulator [Magnetococcales bacterium]